MFKLRGRAGVERVAIKDDAGENEEGLITAWKEFASYSRKINIKFKNDAGTRRDVFFDTLEKVNISLPSKFRRWKCGSDDEDIKCSLVRGGNFAWKGSYEIVFNGMKILKVQMIFTNTMHF